MKQVLRIVDGLPWKLLYELLHSETICCYSARTSDKENKQSKSELKQNKQEQQHISYNNDQNNLDQRQKQHQQQQ